MSWLDWFWGSKPTPQPVAPPAPKVEEVPHPKDIYYTYRPLFNLIGKTEGTDKGRGYNETLAYGKLTGGNVNLVGMTLDEIDSLQTKMLRHPANKWISSAVGRYQIVRTTLRKLKKDGGLSGTVKFSESLQDACALMLLEGRGLSAYLSGSLTEDKFINNLAEEWASLPTTSGRGFYDGQRAAVTVAEVRGVLLEVKVRDRA